MKLFCEQDTGFIFSLFDFPNRTCKWFSFRLIWICLGLLCSHTSLAKDSPEGNDNTKARFTPDSYPATTTPKISDLCDPLGGSVIYPWSEWMESTDFQLPYVINEQGQLILGQWVLQAEAQDIPTTISVLTLTQVPMFMRPPEHPEYSQKAALLWLEEQPILSDGYLSLSAGEQRHLYLWKKSSNQVLRINIQAPADPRLGLIAQDQFYHQEQLQQLLRDSDATDLSVSRMSEAAATAYQHLKWPTPVQAIYLVTFDQVLKKIHLHELPRDGRPYVLDLVDPKQPGLIWKAHMRWQSAKTPEYLPLHWHPVLPSLGPEWTTRETQLQVSPKRADQVLSPSRSLITSYSLSQYGCYQIEGIFQTNQQKISWLSITRRVSPFQAFVRMSGLLTSTSGFILTGDLHLIYQPQSWPWQRSLWGEGLWGRTSFKGQILNNWFQWDPNNPQPLQFYLWGGEARWHIQRGLIDRDKTMWGLSLRAQQTGVVGRNNQHLGIGLFFQMTPPESVEEWLIRPWFSSSTRSRFDVSGHWLLPMSYRVLPIDYIADFQIKIFPNDTWLFSLGGSIYQFSLGQNFYFQSFNAFLGLGLWL